MPRPKRRNADIVLFGHTHNQYTEYLDGLYIMNPGSVGMNGDYGVIDITP
ncbi:MAG: metallophosphoesterase family protein [Eubacterium sp.]